MKQSMEMLSSSGTGNEPWLQWGVLIGASLTAAILDVRHGRIPNALTLPLWLTGLAQAIWLTGVSGLVQALEVSGLLALPYLVLYFLARGGAGDVKLMAALGAWLSFHEGVIVFCCVAVTGLVLAILKIAAHRERKNVVMGMLASLYVSTVTCGTGVRDWRPIAGTGADRTQEPAGQASLPYGAAIFIGVCLGAVGVRVWT